MDSSWLQVADEYDIVFCGGGSAACVTAGRLASADTSLRILVLEAGPHTHEVETHVVPGQHFLHMFPGKTNAISAPHAATASNDHLDGRTVTVITPKCVGGGSNVNWMVYARASASDYDEWERLGNPGWGSQDLLPLLKKMETYQVQANQPTHGYDGPLKVSFGSGISNVGHEFLGMTSAYDKTRKTAELGDMNTLDSSAINLYAAWPKWIDKNTGRRSTTSSYVYSQASNTNLKIAAGCRVKRVIVENGHAVGVEFVHDCTVNPNTYQSVRFVRASRLVVVSAGTFGSPTILERSGIGAKSLLETCGIACVVDLPGVGESYQDHQQVGTLYLASDKAQTMDELYEATADSDIWKATLQQWYTSASGPFARNCVDAGIKYRPDAKDLEGLGPEFEPIWKRYFEPFPDKALFSITVNNGGFATDRSLLPVSKFFGIFTFTLYPLSTGYVHIMSDDVYGPIAFDPAMLKDPADLAVLRWAYKKSREFARRHPFYRGEVGSRHPVFAENSQVAASEAASPIAIESPDLNWTKDDDERIDQFIKKSVKTTFHSLGTCAMKPREQGGVVDHELNVYGVHGLKVADLSIAPKNVGANTNSTAMVVGEKAAIIIARELGLSI